MPLDLPPQSPPAIELRASECRVLNAVQAQAAFIRLKQRLPSTAFAEARPSEICGLVWVKMKRGTIAYTDATGRYLILALALDTHRGSPADVSSALEREIDERETNPAFPE